MKRAFAFCSFLLYSLPGVAAHADVSGGAPYLSGLSMYVETWTALSFVGGKENISPRHNTSLPSGGDARFLIPFGKDWGGQTEVTWEFSDAVITGGGNTRQEFSDAYQFGQHFFFRQNNLWALGAFGGAGQGHGDNDLSGGSYWFSGGEAHGYLGDLTLVGQAGYFAGFEENTALRKNSPRRQGSFFARAEGRYFLSGEQRILGNIAFVNGRSGFAVFPQDATLVEWNIRYDHIFMNVPLLGKTPVFVGYRGDWASLDHPGPNTHLSAHAFYIGTSFSFGGKDFKEFDREGASFDLPNIGRWLTIGGLSTGQPG